MPQNASVEFRPHFQGSTFEGMVATFDEYFGPFDASSVAAAPSFSWKSGVWTDRTLTLITGHYDGEWYVKAAPETAEWLSILVPHRGGFDVALGRTTYDVLPGQLLLANNHQAERFSVRGAPHVSDVLRLDWTIVTQTAAAILERPLHGSLDLMPMVDLASPAGQLFRNVVQTIVVGMSNSGPLLHSPIAMSHLTHALAELLIRTVPHRLSHLLEKQTLSIAPRHVRRAIDFMHANIEKPITMPMVAKAAGVSARTLEMGFRSFKEMTPAAYLRTLRFRAVRSDLLDPLNRHSVKEVCLKWGFLHFGRFSAAYRTIYGENPSDTKRRLNMLGS